MLEEGEVGGGDAIVKVADGPERMTVAQINALLCLPGHLRADLERALRIPALPAGLRLTLRVAERVRRRVPDELPLFVRISATDWADGGWDLDQSVALARELKRLGVDLIDVSSGALVPRARIPVSRGYQVPFARRIRDEAGLLTGAVGLITEPAHANEIVTGGDADLVFLARELLREPYWAQRRSRRWVPTRHGPRRTATPSSAGRARSAGCRAGGRQQRLHREVSVERRAVPARRRRRRVDRDTARRVRCAQHGDRVRVRR